MRERVKLMLLSQDDDVAMWAVEYLTKWGAGAPPKKPRLDVPESATVADLEALLTEEAMEGDRAAILALLAAKDPERYGRQSKKPGDDDSDTPADTDVPAWTPRVEAPT
jgi:hypothetical protein